MRSLHSQSVYRLLENCCIVNPRIDRLFFRRLSPSRRARCCFELYVAASRRTNLDRLRNLKLGGPSNFNQLPGNYREINHFWASLHGPLGELNQARVVFSVPLLPSRRLPSRGCRNADGVADVAEVIKTPIFGSISQAQCLSQILHSVIKQVVFRNTITKAIGQNSDTYLNRRYLLTSCLPVTKACVLYPEPRNSSTPETIEILRVISISEISYRTISFLRFIITYQIDQPACTTVSLKRSERVNLRPHAQFSAAGTRSILGLRFLRSNNSGASCRAGHRE